MPGAGYILALCAALAFSLAAVLEPRQGAWRGERANAKNALELLLGEGRRLFANHFFVKADVYFHSGYYPSMFDATEAHHENHLSPEPGGGEHPQSEQEHEKEMDFLGQPRDWIDRLGRNFYASTHSHLSTPGAERELLPWLRISAELDPHRIETYTVAAFWLRTRLNKVSEAEQFLREGWRENPDSYLILLELGSLYYTDRHDFERARNIWELALKKWDQSEKGKKEPDTYAYEQVLAHLADLEENAGNMPACVRYLEMLEKVTPYPEVIRKQIQERKAKL